MSNMFESSQPATAVKTNKPKRRGDIKWLLWIRDVLVIGTIFLLIAAFVFQPIYVKGESMLNTLKNGEMMIVTKYDYLFNDPDRFDVVICNFPGEGQTVFVKRIVGIPGDRIAIENGMLYINGKAATESYISFPANYMMPETLVETGKYFVLGDNRASSKDSHIVGQLDKRQILGHVRQVVWPLSEYRMIE